jgi:type IX secretion system PorP/SprF family membrane protein
MRNLTLILLFSCVSLAFSFAQQTPVYSQYVLNEFIINPAVAGNDGMTSINITGRKQWLGWEYAPETYSVSISSRILKSIRPMVGRNRPGAGNIKKGSSGRVGLGAAVMKDKNGAINKTTVHFTYAYHIPLFSSQLSFGMNVHLSQFGIDPGLADLVDPGDPLSGFIGTSTYSPDAAVGIDYSTTKWHAGFSVFNLFEAPLKFGEQSVNYRQLRQVRHYYFLGTYRDKFNYSSKWEYEPAIVSRITEKLQRSTDFSIRFIYNTEYWFGFSYRTSHEFILLMGLKLNKLYFGYSFDYGFNEISRLTYGSHEVVIAIKLGDSTRRYRWWERY